VPYKQEQKNGLERKNPTTTKKKRVFFIVTIIDFSMFCKLTKRKTKGSPHYLVCTVRFSTIPLSQFRIT
jgi:hypothetical protein